MTAPEGYLGTDARITSGPAPELVEAGYRLETDDAPLLHRGLSLADLAHQVALVEAGAVPSGVNGSLVAALLDLVDSDPAEFPYDPIYGDAYNSRERELERTLGRAAGWLHLGRTRREAGRIAFRMLLRECLLALHSDISGLATALADAEQVNAATLWADSTYLQPAQPSSFGHYFGHFAEQAVRHLERVEFAYRTADSCPGGAGGAGGTRIPIDRARIATLLGFGSVGQHTRDAMWSVDALSDAVNAAVAAVLTVDEFAEDLEIFASPAFDYLELDASLCRASVLMPQKRNPYALAVIRGGAGTVIGRASGLLATAKSPSARTDNWLYAYGEVAGTLTLAGRLVRLGTAVVRGIRPNVDVLERGAGANFIGAADLAEDLCLAHHLDYRTSYKIVGRAVALAVAAGGATLDPAVVAAAAREITGQEMDIDPALVLATERPEQLVGARNAPGCAAPGRVREHADQVMASVSKAAQWRQARRTVIDDAERDLLETARRLVPSRLGRSPQAQSNTESGSDRVCQTRSTRRA
jgi:argininosuccinate lyase